MGLNKILEWQREKQGRHITIKIGDPLNPEKLSIWCYDYNLQVGQHVQDIFNIDIDLEAEKARQDWELYKELKQKFEEQEADNTYV